jgi:hypothetical protein
MKLNGKTLLIVGLVLVAGWWLWKKNKGPAPYGPQEG